MRWKTALTFVCVVAAVSCKKTGGLVPTAAEQLTADIAIIDEYLADNRITAMQHVSGLRWVINTEGSGENVTSDDCIRFDYSGRLLFETEEFESNTGVSGPMIGLIKGWRIGLKEVNKGGTITLYIPSGLAYGTQGTKRNGDVVIPANANLVFTVTIHNITKYNSAGAYCYPWP